VTTLTPTATQHRRTTTRQARRRLLVEVTSGPSEMSLLAELSAVLDHPHLTGPPRADGPP
jgi:hypothetical protein